MKNIKLFRILFILLVIFTSFIFIDKVQANSINSITMDINVDSNGDAHITEIWNCTTTEGTEAYHPYYNLGKSQITNFTVKENGTTYTTLSSWDINGSFNNKKYKCGINNISDGVELCWGISSYGKHNYELNYTITNFVSNLTDSQIIYWTLIPYEMSNTVGNVDIKIYSDFAYSNTLDVWGYGKEGAPCYVYNGYIEMTSGGTLEQNEYMTILVKFPSGTFNTSSDLYEDFDFYYQMAEDGATKYIDEDFNYYQMTEYGTTNDAILIISFALFFVIFITIFVVAIVASKNPSFSGDVNYLNFQKTGDRLPKDKDIEYFRDIPCNKDVFRAYFISFQYSLIKNKTDFLGTLLLKWLKEDKIHLEKRTVGKLKKKEETCVILDPSFESENELEESIYNMLIDASNDNILEPNEFKKWCSKHYSKVLNWFTKVLKAQKETLINQNKISVEEKGIFKIKQYTPNSTLFEEAKQLKGLKKFLKDFTLISKREPIEVKLFEEYLMYAQIFGIANEVSKQFEKLYPDMIQDLNYNYSDILFIHHFSYIAMSSAQSAYSAANSYSSGGGGFSSGGGGRWFIRWRWRPVEVSVKTRK